MVDVLSHLKSIYKSVSKYISFLFTLYAWLCINCFYSFFSLEKSGIAGTEEEKEKEKEEESKEEKKDKEDKEKDEAKKDEEMEVKYKHTFK